MCYFNYFDHKKFGKFTKMHNSGGFAVTRAHSGDRFYNPPAMRRRQQLLLQQQQQLQLQRRLQRRSRVDSAEAESLGDSDESTLSKPNSVGELSNLNRLIDSVTPFAPVRYSSSETKSRMRGWRTCEADTHPFFTLGDLWDSLNEWSVYGVEVPLLLDGFESVKQYYVPSLSGIQLYVDPHRLRRPGEDSDAESLRETSSAGSSDSEAERQAKDAVAGTWGQHNHMNLQRFNRLALSDKPTMSSSSDETEVCNSPGWLVFEYLEQEQPHHRQPLYDKVSSLASQNPEIRTYKSCDLLPSSWVSVAWYPIYRIPVGPTLQTLDASFLTFHSLSTAKSKNQPQFNSSSGQKFHSVEGSLKIPLPVFGLASYKLRGSILTPNGANEWQLANSLLQAADNWLSGLQVYLPDFQFFVSHSPQWR